MSCGPSRRRRRPTPRCTSWSTAPVQEGGPTRHRVVIGWGRQDRVTLPRQAARAQERFPDAGLVWFGRCGHFPHWDRPDATARVILTATA